MKNEKETRQRLLDCAKKEFMEKGYTSASLRCICRNAGVTTGALYFFFKDKADLFAALVEEPVNKLYEIMMNHYQEERGLDISKLKDPLQRTEDLETALQIVHYMFRYHDEFQLVLMKSQGSGYEDCIDKFVDITERHYRQITDQICQVWNCSRLDDYTIHWIAHMHIDTFVHMISHESSEEEACRHMKQTVYYLLSGFFGMLKAQK